MLNASVRARILDSDESSFIEGKQGRQQPQEADALTVAKMDNPEGLQVP